MKLQNRNNLEIIADLNGYWELYDNGDQIILNNREGYKYKYSTLTELYKQWKDYTTLLPVAFRESFKQWAKFNEIEEVQYHKATNRSWFSGWVSESCSDISYGFNTCFDYLEDYKKYTVTELVDE